MLVLCCFVFLCHVYHRYLHVLTPSFPTRRSPDLTAGLYLAQFGAEVIRVDQIGGGPDFRRWPVTAENNSLYWENLNRAKKSLALDLTRPEGRELLQAL